MKTNTLLLLASLAVLAINASAAQSQPEPFVLPAYVVETPRYSPAEQQINASLNELRHQAHTPVVICPELTALKAQVRQDSKFVHAAKDSKAARVAKS
jgi:hypothetical protein